MPRLTRLILISSALVSAIVLACLSVHVEQTGPELLAYGNLCGQSGSDPCYRPVLKGGYPIAYLSDAPGVSVERQLSFGEDRLSPGAFVADIAIYFAIVLLAIRVVTRRRSGRF